MALGDVAPFHRFARLYDLGMWRADPDRLRAGLALADRPVETLLDVGGGTGRASRALSGYERVVVDALHHMADPERVFAAARRVLHPGGVLLIREFDPTTLRGRGVVAAERVVGFDSTFWPPANLADRLAGAGLDARVVEKGFGYTVIGVTDGR